MKMPAMTCWTTARRLALVVLVAGACSQTGCTSWRAQKETAEQVLAKKPQRHELRVTLATGLLVTVHTPRIEGDSLRGVVREPPKNLPKEWLRGYAWDEESGTWSGRYAAIPSGMIQKVEVLTTDVAETTLLLLAFGVTAVAIIAATYDDDKPTHTSSSSSSSGGDYMSCPIVLCEQDGLWHIDSGTYAGAIMPALARSDVDNLEHASARDGELRVRLTGLSGETEHVDALTLLAVDHQSGESFAPDATGRVRYLGRLQPPLRAVDLAGRNALQRVSRRDEWCWESALEARDASAGDQLEDGVELEFARPEGAATARLAIDGANTVWAMHLMRTVVAMHGRGTEGWYRDIAASPQRAERIKQTMVRETSLHVWVWTKSGWERQGLISEVGPECLKRQLVALDLSQVSGPTVRVRLLCVPNLWLVDCVSIDYSPEQPAEVMEIHPETAFDGQGADVREKLGAVDKAEYVIAPGDTAEVTFRIPPIPAGRHRTYLARTTGWYQIHAPNLGEPEAGLERLETEPHAVARFAVTRMNESLKRMASWDESGRP